ncbi:MAG: hypothetical protein PHI34_13985 [Acidobacteriota bacterium]|nr:hypothetical protein [Acidobacteriota bacterium]
MPRYAPVLIAAVLLAAWPAAAAGQDRSVDCVAAVVNGAAITRFDVDVAEAVGLFNPVKGADAAARRLAILELLVDQKLILDQVQPAVPPDPAVVDTEWRRLSARIGADTLAARLARLGAAEADVRPYLEERIRSRKIVADRFQRTVSVSLREIEAYYADIYVKARQAEGRAAQPLVDVLDAIEAEIKKGKVETQAAAWIDALREQAEVEIRRDCLK